MIFITSQDTNQVVLIISASLKYFVLLIYKELDFGNFLWNTMSNPNYLILWHSVVNMVRHIVYSNSKIRQQNRKELRGMSDKTIVMMMKQQQIIILKLTITPAP